MQERRGSAGAPVVVLQRLVEILVVVGGDEALESVGLGASEAVYRLEVISHNCDSLQLPLEQVNNIDLHRTPRHCYCNAYCGNTA